MGTRYKVLQTAAAFLAALGAVAVLGDARAQQEEIDAAAQQSGQYPGAKDLGTVGPTEDDLIVGPFDIDGNKFRLAYKTTNLDKNGVPFLDVTVLDKDDDEVSARVIRDEGTETEIVTEGPGTFTLEARAQDLIYEITVEDCTGKDKSGRNNKPGRKKHSRSNNNNDNSGGKNKSGGENRSAAGEQYGGRVGVDELGPGQVLRPLDEPGTGDNSGFGTGRDTTIPEDFIAGTIPDTNTLPFTDGPPLFGFIGLACVSQGVAVLRRAARPRPIVAAHEVEGGNGETFRERRHSVRHVSDELCGVLAGARGWS